MEKKIGNIPPAAVHNGTEKSENKTDDNKKYNFYRKPSIKKKAPEVKQTLTSYKRMLKANPLLKFEMEGKDVSLLHKQFSSSSNHNKVNIAFGKQSLQPEKLSLQPNTNSQKPSTTNLQRSKSLKNPPKNVARPNKPLKKSTSSVIISGCNPEKGTHTNISKQSNVDFNTSTSDFLSSTRLDNNTAKGINSKKEPVIKSTHASRAKSRAQPLTQHNYVSSSGHPAPPANERKVKKPIRRSLSAQHFDKKKGIVKPQPENCFTRTELTQSLTDISRLQANAPTQICSPIAEGSRESIGAFRTPSAYERRSICRFTPKSVASVRRSLCYASTPLPSLSDLQKRLNSWLTRRGKSLSTFHHLKCFGILEEEPIDEENKENIEVEDKGSYEDLKIIVSPENSKISNEPVLNGESAESIAKAALEDLLKLIQEGYPRPQCEGWLELIRRKYNKLEEEPQYWECRAAIEQSRGNISNAVQCYTTAIVQGAEIQAVDESLDILLKKFSLLNISTDQVECEKSIKERARIVQDARNVFKSSIIQFAVQERKLKKNCKDDVKTLVATPVRRSTRLSRSAYTSTPGVKICSSLRDLGKSGMDMVDFKKNTAIF